MISYNDVANLILLLESEDKISIDFILKIIFQQVLWSFA